MRLPKFQALILAFATVVAAPGALALSVIPPTFEQLVGTADAVVDAEVTGVRTELSSFEGRPLVYTYVAFRIDDALKGAPGSTVELRMLGGTVGDVTLRVSGVPQFHVGERHLLFIEGNGKNFCPLVGVTHGFYPIARRGSDDAEVVLRSNGEPLAEVAEVAEDLHSHAQAHGAKRDLGSAMTLSDFKNRIRLEVARAREQ